VGHPGFLVRTKDSLKKDLDALRSLVETFAEREKCR